MNVGSDDRKEKMNNTAFCLEKVGEKMRMCEVFYISTLDITNRSIRSVISRRQIHN